MPNTDAKRHHFVPQLLLRRFCRSSDERLFQLEVRTGKPVRVTTREAASRRRYYQFQDDEGNKSNAVEAYFGLVETYAAPALERLTHDERISDPDRATLSFFFALLGMRTPGIRKLGEAIGRDAFEYFIGSTGATPKRLRICIGIRRATTTFRLTTPRSFDRRP